MSEKSQFLELVLEEAFRRHGNDVSKALWYICEQSNMPRVRARFLCAQWDGKKGGQTRP